VDGDVPERATASPGSRTRSYEGRASSLDAGQRGCEVAVAALTWWSVVIRLTVGVVALTDGPRRGIRKRSVITLGTALPTPSPAAAVTDS
jgi:hypothetical protein